MRKSIVAGNWKMNMGLKEGIALFSEISELVKAEVNGDQGVIVCPPYIHISSLAQSSIANDKVKIGAQN